MLDTGYKSAGNGTNQAKAGSGSSWLTPGSIISSDNIRASSEIPTEEYSDWLRAYNFNCGIPTGATIVGIEVSVERKSAHYGVNRDDDVKLAVGVSGKGDDKADTDDFYPISDTITVYGGSTDLWGTTWSAADINDLSVFYSVANDACCNEICSVDHIQVRIWYTVSVSVPTLTTQAVTDITDTTATGNGNIINLGGENCTKRGICWNTTGTPTVADNKSEEIGSFTTGSFSRAMTALPPGTHFHVRAYAYNSAGYGYGNEMQFDTTGATVVAPTVTTQAVSDIGDTTATGNGNITATGGENCTQGICWDTSTGPTAADDHVENSGIHGTGAFTGSMAGLAPGVHYYVKAYAYNSAGYSYGAEVEFDATGSGTSCIGSGNFPDSGAEVARAGSSSTWTNPTSILVDDAVYAFWVTAIAAYSPWLKGGDFGFNIPGDATIDGIRVEIDRYASLAAKTKDSSLRLVVNSVLKGDDKADVVNYYPTSPACVAYGDATDLWGTTWTPADINNIEVYLSTQKLVGSSISYVDYITVRVWYTEAGGAAAEKNAVAFGANF